jgi:putative ABC transport system permease protein
MQDVRYALRTMRRQPVFAATVILTLAVAIGMNAAIFSVMNAVVLRPLGYPGADRLVWLSTTSSDSEPGLVTGPDFVAWREQARSFDRMMAYITIDSPFVSPRGSARVRTAVVTEDFWDLSHAIPETGRLPIANERDVVLLSYQFAQQWFDRTVVGRTITLDGRQVTIVGVLPEHFRFHLPGAMWGGIRPKDVDVYEPITVDGARGTGPIQLLHVVGRLDASTTLERARVELQQIRDRLAQEYPNAREAHRALRVVALQDQLIGAAKPALIVLLGAVACVLLVACANTASLLLARASARQREIAVRLSMGAGRARLIRQLLTESLVLALIGSAAGLLIARLGIAAILRIHPYAIPRLNEATIDARVLAVVLGTSVLTALLFGLAPAFNLGNTRPHEAFRSSGQRTLPPGVPTRRTRGTLVSVQIALALTLVIGAGLLVRSAWRLHAYPSGFEPARVLTATITFAGPRYAEPHSSLAFADALLARVRKVAGVEAASISTHGYMLSPGLPIEGAPPFDPATHGQQPPITINATSSALKQVLGLRVVRGRWFDDGERAAVLNESLARREFPGRDPLGQRVRFNPDAPPLTIVGIVADLKYSQLDQAAEPEVYVPYPTIVDGLFGFHMLVRTTGDAAGLAPTVRALMAEVDSTQVPDAIVSLEQALTDAIAPRRLNLFLFGTFAAAAVFVAMIGIYGVMAYAVTRRLHEIGIRTALGASQAAVVSMVMGQGLRLTAAGIVAGVAAAFVLTRFMTDLLYDVKPSDPWTFVVLPIGIAITALVACGIPAIRAAFVDPAIILRDE